MGSSYPGLRRLGRWYGKHHVPSFLAPWIPVVWYDGKIACEFLSGNTGGSKNMGTADMIYVRIGLAGDAPGDEIKPLVIS